MNPIVDEQVAFYIRHRLHIEQWAKLREPAASELSDALRSAAENLSVDSQLPPLSVTQKGAYTSVSLPLGTTGAAEIVLRWVQRDLFKLSGHTRVPYIGVVVADARRGTRIFDRVKTEIEPIARPLGLTKSDPVSWVLWGPLPEMSADEYIDAYAQECVATYTTVWERLHDAISEAIAEG